MCRSNDLISLNMNTYNNNSVSRNKRLIIWFLIFFQILFPLSISSSFAAPPSVFVKKPYVDHVHESPFSIDKSMQKEDANLSMLTDHIHFGANALASDNVSQTGENFIRSKLNNEFNSSSQKWLSKFGTARVQLNFDEDFSFNNSALDLLVPIYEDPKAMLFTQIGARNKDGRNTINFGTGVRTFQNSWMYGGNAFFDNDITGKNRRIGLGAEAWSDFIKFSANTYFSTTDWHQSREFIDYNERPANGFDVRAEAYLPSYSQFGGKLIFEKYRGNEVALFGKDARQKNPHALTAGVSYTPFPLLTVGAEHRAGKNNKNDSNINFQLSYRLGESWSSHFNPSSVESMRTLSISRYDLVERNNHIVLDYKKQDLIRISLPESLMGMASNQLPVIANVKSKYAVERVEWESHELVLAGGSISKMTNNEIMVTLPKFITSNQIASNAYHLTAIAYDSKGNSSNKASTIIYVSPQVINLVNSDVTANPDTLFANGVSTSQILIKLFDDNQNPVSGIAQDINITSNFTSNQSNKIQQNIGTNEFIISGIIESSPGIYLMTFTSGYQPGLVTVTPSINNKPLKAVNITLITAATAAVDSLTPDVTTALADGTDLITFTAIVKDGSGHVVPDAEVAFTTTGGSLAAASAMTDSNGAARVTLSHTSVESVTVTAKSAGGSDAGKSQAVAFTADAATAAVDSLTPDVTTALADGTDLITFTAIVKDGSGHVVPDAEVAFTTTGGSLAAASAMTDSNGAARVTLSHTSVESVTVTAKSAGGSDAGKSQAVAFTADAATAAVDSLTPDVTTALADGTDLITFTAIVKDGSGHVVPDAEVAFTTTGGSLAAASAMTDSSGAARVTLSHTSVESVTVTAKSAGGSDAGKSQAVAFTADAATAAVDSLTPDVTTALADGTDLITFTAIVKDGSGHVVPDAEVAFTTTGGSLAAASAMTDSSGAARVTLSHTSVESVTVTAKSAGGSDAGKSQAVAFTADAATAAVDSLTPDVTTALADGTDLITFTAIVKDGSGHVVPDAEVAFTTTGGSLAAASAMTDSSGAARVTLSHTSVESVTVTAKSAGGSDAGKSQAVAFTADAATAAVDSLTPDVTTALADGTDLITFTAIVKDGSGHVVLDAEVAFTTTGGSLAAASAMTDSNGAARVTLSHTSVESVTVTAKSAGGSDAGKSQAVAFTADAATAAVDSLTPDVTTALADGTDLITFTAIVKDGSGHVVPDAEVAFTTTGGSLAAASAMTDSSGAARVTLSHTSVESVTVTAKSAGGSDAGKSQAVAFTADAATAAVDSLTPDVTTALADGTDLITFTAIVKDGSGHVVPDAEVAFTTTGGSLAAASAMTDSSGAARVTLSHTSVESVTVTAKSAGGSDAGKSQAVAFTADAATAAVDSLTPDVTTALADGTDLITFTAIVKDGSGHVVPDAEVAFTTTGGSLAAASAMTDSSGAARVTLSHTSVESVTVTAKSAGGSDAGKSQAVAFTADAATAAVDSLTPDVTTALADGTDLITFTAIVKDGSGHVVPDAEVAFTTTGGSLAAASAMTDSNGAARVTLSHTSVESVTVTAKSAGGSDAGKSQAVAFTADAATAAVDSLTPDVTTAPVGGKPVSVVAILKDSKGNIVANQPIIFSVTGSAQLDNSQGNTNIDGEVTITLSNIKSETVNVTAKSGVNTADQGKNVMIEFNTDAVIYIEQASEKAKVGEAITSTIKITQSNGEIFPQQVPVTLSLVSSANRQNVNWNSNVLVNGNSLNSFSGLTDLNGEMKVTFTEPSGEGVKTVIRVESQHGGSKDFYVIFTVLTSPDTDKAQMWGHMINSVNGVKRPLLDSETSFDTEVDLRFNEAWALMSFDKAYATCQPSVLPSVNQLTAVHQGNTPVATNLGWPLGFKYRSSTKGNLGFINVSLRDGTQNDTSADDDSALYVSCQG